MNTRTKSIVCAFMAGAMLLAATGCKSEQFTDDERKQVAETGRQILDEKVDNSNNTYDLYDPTINPSNNTTTLLSNVVIETSDTYLYVEYPDGEGVTMKYLTNALEGTLSKNGCTYEYLYVIDNNEMYLDYANHLPQEVSDYYVDIYTEDFGVTSGHVSVDFVFGTSVDFKLVEASGSWYGGEVEEQDMSKYFIGYLPLDDYSVDDYIEIIEEEKNVILTVKYHTYYNMVAALGDDLTKLFENYPSINSINVELAVPDENGKSFYSFKNK